MNTSILLLILLIIATILVIVYFVIQSMVKYNIVKKELAEAQTKIIYEKEFLKVNYDNDIKVLMDTIDEYTNNLSFSELKEYQDSKNIINDKIFDELTKRITVEIYNSLSGEYKSLLTNYVADIHMFIYEKVYYKTLPIVLSINKKNIHRNSK